MAPVIRLLHQTSGAAQAYGLAVVIDVLRAFSTACYVAAGGARRILAVADAQAAVRLKQRFPRARLLGERDGFRIPGFDLGNSPSEAVKTAWRGRTAIMTTSNGTAGLMAARGADEVLAGSFVNAGATVAYIQRRAPAEICLVCMGSHGRPAIGDTLCALSMAAALRGGRIDFARLKRAVLTGRGAGRFLASTSPDLPPADLEMCLAPDLFQFALVARKHPEHGLSLHPVAACAGGLAPPDTIFDLDGEPD